MASCPKHRPLKSAPPDAVSIAIQFLLCMQKKPKKKSTKGGGASSTGAARDRLSGDARGHSHGALQHTVAVRGTVSLGKQLKVTNSSAAVPLLSSVSAFNPRVIYSENSGPSRGVGHPESLQELGIAMLAFFP